MSWIQKIILITLCPLALCAEEPKSKLSEERSDFPSTISLSFSYLDMLIPSKWGVKAETYDSKKDLYHELEYQSGSFGKAYSIIDLGEFSEKRYSYNSRHFAGRKSFNWYWGFSYSELDINLGSKYLASIPITKSYSEYELLKISSLGFNLGLGHRWLLGERVDLRVDWLTWTQPIFVIQKQAPYTSNSTDPDDRNLVDKTLKALAYTPRFGLVKMAIGFRF